MDLQRAGRQLALAFVNTDDIVLARELSGSGTGLLSFAGRSLVGTAVVGAGMATRAAVLGAQVATKSALAVAGAAKGRIPGADVVEQIAYDLDQSVGRRGEGASYVASQGVELGKAEPRPPAEPIFGDAWLGKRLPPGASSGTVLFDSAAELTRLAALPLTFGSATLASAVSSPMGQQVTRTFWDALSSIVDSLSPRSTGRTAKSDRSEKRAALLMVGMTPLVVAAQDMVELAEGLSRAAGGDGRKLRSVLTRALARLEAADGAAGAAEHTPARLFSALDANEAGELARMAAVGSAMLEDSAALTRLGVAYGRLLGGLLVSSLQSSLSGTFDVDDIEAWIRADEATGSAAGRPASVKQLETLVAEFSAAGGDLRDRGFFVPSTIELARDTIFGCSTRALGREAALARMERLFGTAVRDRLRDDCSLRSEILDAKSGDRDRQLAALVTKLQREGRTRLLEAREHAAARLATLTENSAERILEQFAPRIGERAAVLQRFIGMADTANALERVPSDEARRERVVARFDEWISTPSGPPEVDVELA